MSFKNFLPHIVALLIFVILSLVYFYPVLEGYKLIQGDIEKHKSLSHEITSHQDKYDENALWSGNMFAGMPTYLTTKVKYSGNIVKYLLVAAKGGLPHPASAIFAYLLGFFILFLCLRINPWLAIMGAIAFAFSSYFLIIIEAGHNSKTYAIAFMAPILGGFLEVTRGKIRVGALLIAVFTALELYVNHVQITYYLFFVLLFVGVGELVIAIKGGALKEFSKRIVIVLLAAFLGVLPNIGNLLITYEYSKQSTRGRTDLTIQADGQSNQATVSSGLDKDYITQWSYGIDETFTLIVPNAKGGKSIPILGMENEVERLRKEDPQFFNVLVNEYQKNQNAIPSYFGDQPIVSGPVYIGIIVVALALLALLFVKDVLVVALFSVTVLTMALSWGKNFMGLTEFFIDYVPMYNKFRAVAMILLVAEFTAPILAILFIDKLIKEREQIKLNPKKLYFGLGGVLLLVAAIAISPETFVDLTSANEQLKINASGANASNVFKVQDQVEQYRSNIVSQSAWGSFKYLALASILLVLFLFGKLKKELLVVGIGALILVDLWIVDKTYLNNEKGKGRSTSGTKYVNWVKPIKQLIPYEPSAIDQAILQKEINQKPELSKLIQDRIENYKKENNTRLDNRKLFDLQFAELMDQTHFRVLNTNARLDQDVQTPFFLKTLGGYHGAKMKKYQELIDFYLGIEHYQVRQAFAQAGTGYVQQMLPSLKITNLLNAKYIIGPDNTRKAPATFIENPYAYGNAWFVNSVRVVENADSAMLTLGKVDLKSIAVIEEEDANSIKEKSFQISPSDFIRLKEYDPNRMTYEYSASSDQFAVFSEIYYSPGWKVYINKNEVDFTKVDYTLRGMNVPKGKGTIEFVFDPLTVSIGEKLTWASSAIILLLLIGVVYRGVKPAEKEES